ncbi:RidA family protein [Rhodococcus koreensis]
MSTITRGGPFAYASSLAIDVVTMSLVPEADTVRNETRLVFDRITAQLESKGASLGDVIKTTCYLRDESYLAEFVQAYDEVFQSHSPATHIAILGIAGNCRVQIEVVATRTPAERDEHAPIPSAVNTLDPKESQ